MTDKIVRMAPGGAKAIPGQAEYEAIEVLVEAEALLDRYSDRFCRRGTAKWIPINRRIGKARWALARAIRDLQKQRDAVIEEAGE